MFFGRVNRNGNTGSRCKKKHRRMERLEPRQMMASDLFQAAKMAGDYNLDGNVDAADYVVFRKTFGSTTDLRADGNVDGMVDAADGVVWRSNLNSKTAIPRLVDAVDSVFGAATTNAALWEKQAISSSLCQILADGTLSILGTSQSDRVELFQKANQLQVRWANRGVSVFEGIRQLRFRGGEGDDQLTADSSVSISINAYGEGGSDILSGGSGKNVVDGGAGNDILYAHDGDVVDGGDGTDELRYLGANAGETIYVYRQNLARTSQDNGGSKTILESIANVEQVRSYGSETFQIGTDPVYEDLRFWTGNIYKADQLLNAIQDFAGRWFINGQPTGITSNGGSSLTFTNEFASVTTGRLLANSRLQAGPEWNNLGGTIEKTPGGLRIRWDNGTVWDRAISDGQHGSFLVNGEYLHPGNTIYSPNGRFRLSLETDGNLVLSAPWGPIWSTGTAGRGVGVAYMQADGNLVLYGNGAAWASNTVGNGSARLSLQDDGNLVIYRRLGGAIWSTGTWWTGNVSYNEGIFYLTGADGGLIGAFANGALKIAGSKNADRIEMWRVDNMIKVQVNERICYFPIAGVQQIEINAGAGDDFVSLHEAWIGVSTIIFGADGHDTLIGSSSDDILIGGAGNDSLYGGEGNDVLFGEGGSDTLVGGKGNDWLFAGYDGSDQLDPIYDLTHGDDTYVVEGASTFKGAYEFRVITRDNAEAVRVREDNKGTDQLFYNDGSVDRMDDDGFWADFGRFWEDLGRFFWEDVLGQGVNISIPLGGSDSNSQDSGRHMTARFWAFGDSDGSIIHDPNPTGSNGSTFSPFPAYRTNPNSGAPDLSTIVSRVQTVSQRVRMSLFSASQAISNSMAIELLRKGLNVEGGPLAVEFFNNYLNAGGNKKVDLAALLKANPNIQALLAGAIRDRRSSGVMSGSVIIEQTDYGLDGQGQDYRHAIGGMTIAWSVEKSEGATETIRLSMDNVYKWHPNEERWTQTVHKFMELQKSKGAREFRMQGETAIQIVANPLDVARYLVASKFQDWSYGTDYAKQQIDCVQFLLAVVEESAQGTLDLKVQERILIANLSEEEKSQSILGTLVVEGDERTKGVQSALVQAGLGTAVSVADVRPGDLIQYWMKKQDGTWFGHAGIIESVDPTGSTPKARIFGAHASPEPGIIGTSSFEINLTEATDDRRIYVVRMN